MKYVTLNNGVKMPILDYGVFQIVDQEECERCVLDAISVGYRSIDTAQAYGNEEAVGSAVNKQIRCFQGYLPIAAIYNGIKGC